MFCYLSCFQFEPLGCRPIHRLLKKRGADLRAFTKGGGESSENFDFEAKIRGLNSVSGEKLHDFEITCPAREMSLHPQHPRCVWACGHAHISTSLFD